MRKLTIDEVKSRGYSVVLYQAVQLAGGPAAIARELGLSSAVPYHWFTKGGFPIERAAWLASRTEGRITADEILEAVAKFQPRRAAVVELVRKAEANHVGA